MISKRSMSKSSTDLYSRFCQALDQNGFQAFTSVLIAFSGGADSSVLLHLYHRLSKERPITLAALHLNHRIRPDADEDARFCERVCREYGIPFALFSEDVPAFAKRQRCGIEEAAREVRYRILEAYRQENQSQVIATAHNATDHAETVLFHLARGTSLTGASGIPIMREAIIRPLLSFTKSEILAYAEENGIPYRTDETNFDMAYSRNLIRHTVLPTLNVINPSFEAAILRFSDSAKEDDEALYEIAKTYADCEETETLATFSPAILKRVLLIKYRKTAHNEISRLHLEKACEFIRLALQNHKTYRLSLPGKIVFTVTKEKARFEKKTAIPPKEKVNVSLTPTSDFIFADRFRIKVETSDAPEDSSALFSFFVPKDALGAITARTRSEGDRYRQGNMTRNIKKMLCDAKVPVALRDVLPLILFENTIVFVPYLPVSDLLREWEIGESESYRISVFTV